VSLKAKLEALCKNADYAVTLFLKTFTHRFESRYDYINNVKWYGVSESVVHDVETNLSDLLYSIDLKDDLRDVSSCIEIFSDVLEKRIKERIKKLSEFETRVLKYASYWLNLNKGSHLDNKVFLATSEGVDHLVESVCATLSVDESRAKDVQRLLAQTGLAFYYYRSLSRKHIYIIPKYALRTIESLAREAESELSSVRESLHKLDSKTLTAILIKLLGAGGARLFSAVYGFNYYDFLKSLDIEGLCYSGYVNYSLRDAVTFVVKEAIEKRCHKLYNSIKGILAEKGYISYMVTMPDTKTFYCVFKAVKPGRHDVTIHVMPFPYMDIYDASDKKTVVVFEGPIARPEEFRGLVVVGMDEEFAGVKVIVDNVGSEWSREVIEVFKSLQLTKAIEELTSEPPIRVEVTHRVYSPPRELLERIVAEVLGDLGFNVKTNARVPARRGGLLEVDVWAVKRAGDSTFRVYVSCKNWDRDVDRSVVDEEFGRVLNLREIPHLRILVVKSMTGPAREIAEADGFYVVELGEKAVAGNEEEIYKLVYRKLSEIFTGIAPPQLQEIARRVGETAKRAS